MIRVLDIWDEAKKIVGSNDESFLFRRITDAVELLANKGDFDPLIGWLDICVSNRVVTLPSEVETILGLSMVGQPALARDALYQFHLNGPGSCDHPIRYEWMDLAQVCTYREMPCPGKLRAYCVENEDESAEVWIYGFDQNGDVVRTKVGDEWRDGWQVPVFKFLTAIADDAPTFSRITAIRKAQTAGPIRLTTVNTDGEFLLGVYQAGETVPQFRRIRLSHSVPWVRIEFRRRTFEITSKQDLLPLHSRQAVVMMLRALKAYDEPSRFAEGEAFEATAVRWLVEEQLTVKGPVAHPLQVLDSSPLMDPCDHMI